MSSSKNHFDVIVIGVGSMGSAACYYLAKRGLRVLGLEQFSIPHERGSHTGQSRIIRKAYFEHPDYVPLLERSYENWKELENLTGTKVYYATGLIYFGQPDHWMIKGVKQSADLYKIPLEKLNQRDASKAYPQFSIPGNFEALFEPEAGFITPENAIRLYSTEASKKGATIQSNEKLIEWKLEGNGVSVKTEKGIYYADKLVISTGAWSDKIIPGYASTIVSTRQTVTWINPRHNDSFSLGKFPCWMLADDAHPGLFYGFPVLPNSFEGPQGLKLAHHHPGIPTDPDLNQDFDRSKDEKLLTDFLQQFMPGTFESVNVSKTCFYGNSPDENFIIDLLHGYEDKVAIACGFSGHGFKFASAVGEILADLAVDGKTKQAIEFLGASRFVG